jgi:hypothetical protein
MKLGFSEDQAKAEEIAAKQMKIAQQKAFEAVETKSMIQSLT